MKSKFSTHIAYFWWFYALMAIVFALFWSFITDIALRPAPTEQLKIYTLGENIDTEELKSDIADVLPNITSQKIKNIQVGRILDEVYIPTALNSLLYARAQECDFIIVEDALIPEESFAPAYFNIYEQEKISEILGDVVFYVEEYKDNLYTYGIKISGDGMKNNFTKYYGEEGRCWLMFCFKKDNMGELSESLPNDAALQTIKWLITEVE